MWWLPNLSCVGLYVDDIRFTRNKSLAIKILCINCDEHLKGTDDRKNSISSLKNEWSSRLSSLEGKISVTSTSEIGDLKASIEIIKKDLIDIKSSNAFAEINEIKVSVQ